MRHEIVRCGVALTLAALVIGCSKSPTGPSAAAGGGSVTVAQVALSGTLSLPEGNTSQLTATATRSDGSTQDVTSQATWTSSDPTIGPVSIRQVRRGDADVISPRFACGAGCPRQEVCLITVLESKSNIYATSRRARGFLSATSSNVRAAPDGARRPCSHS